MLLEGWTGLLGAVRLPRNFMRGLRASVARRIRVGLMVGRGVGVVFCALAGFAVVLSRLDEEEIWDRVLVDFSILAGYCMNRVVEIVCR